MRSHIRASFVLAAVPVLIGFLYACGDDAPAGAPADAGTDGDNPAADSPANDDVVIPPTANLWKSGTRLRAEVLQVGEAKKFETFFDVARNETCGMATINAETYRCFPEGTTVLYDDAECKTPIATSLSECNADRKYITRFIGAGDTCLGRRFEMTNVWQRGAEVPARDTFDRQADGTCTPRPATTTAKYYALGAEVPLTDFVSATIAREDVSPAIARERLRGEDGSEVAREVFFDRARGANVKCAVTRLGLETAPVEACAPFPPGYADDRYGPYSDSACGTPVATHFQPATCSAPDIIRRGAYVDAGMPDADTRCISGYEFKVHAVGAPVASAFEVGASGCAARPAVPDEKFYAIGAEIDSKTLPQTPSIFFGGAARGRIKAPSTTGLQLGHGTFADNEKVCFPSKFADGKEYCVPEDTARVADGPTLFKDAACKEPIYLASVCATTIPFVIAGANAACKPFAAMGYEVGPKLAITQYWMKPDATTCDGPHLIADTGGGAPFDLLAQVPVSTKLQEVKRVRE